MKIEQASGFAEEVFHLENAFFETPLGHRFQYDEKLQTDVSFKPNPGPGTRD